MNRGILFGLALSVGILILLSAEGSATYPPVTSGNIDAYDMSTLSAGKVKDFGPSALDLTISGPSSTSTACGGSAGAYVFNGVTDKMSNTASPLASATSWSIAFHAKPTLLSEVNTYLLTFGAGSRAVLYGYHTNQYEIYDGSFKASTTIANTDCHWIIFTYDSGATTLKSYLDGTQITTTNTVVTLSGTGTFYVGTSGSADFWGGTLDELYIYNRALTAPEVDCISNNVCTQNPVVTTGEGTIITCSTTIVNGNLSSMGSSTSVTVGFQFGVSPTLSGADNITVETRNSTGTFSLNKSGLAESTFYYFRAWANGTNATYAQGAILYFQTLACPTICGSDPYSPSNLWSVGFLIGVAVVLAVMGGATHNRLFFILSGIAIFFIAFYSGCMGGLVPASLVVVVGMFAILEGIPYKGEWKK